MTATPPPPPPAAHAPAAGPAHAATAEQIAEIAVAIARRKLVKGCVTEPVAPAHPCNPDCRAAVWSLIAQLRSALDEVGPLPAHLAAVERRLEG